MANNEFMAHRDVYKRKGWTGAFKSVRGVADSKVRIPMYRQGISFENPTGPLHPIEQRTLDLVRFGKIAPNNSYSVRQPLWRNAIKARVAKQLKYTDKIIPTFNELSLGAGVEPTTETTATQRNFWGALTNLVSAGAGAYQTTQEARLAKIQAQIAAQEQALRTSTTPSNAMHYLPWVLGLGGGALLVTTLLKKRR